MSGAPTPTTRGVPVRTQSTATTPPQRSRTSSTSTQAPAVPLRRESTLATTSRTASTNLQNSPQASLLSSTPPTSHSPTPLSPRISSAQSVPSLARSPTTTSRTVQTTTRTITNRTPENSNPSSPSPRVAPVVQPRTVASPPIVDTPVTPARVAPVVTPRVVTRGAPPAASNTPGDSRTAASTTSTTPRDRGTLGPGNRVAASRATIRERRISKLIIDKEKKTDYWQEIIQEARIDSPELTQEDVNNMISRCLVLELVGNWKTRENQGNGNTPLTTIGPKAKELFEQLSQKMEEKLIQLNNGRPVTIEGTGFAKIRNMEQQLQAHDVKSEKDQEMETERVKAKITEITTSLGNLEKKKEQERETHRRTMTMEINNLREQMLKAAKEPQADQKVTLEQNRGLAQKVTSLETALKSMNEDKKGEDNETALLKRKLALFESKMKQLEEDKKIREAESHNDNMKDKLVLMEEKLAKMERRKSVSITMMMQEKMQQVEKQLEALRSTGAGPGAEREKIIALEKKLVELQTTKVIPSMINDPETRALRSHIKKMEEAMEAAEKKIEADRIRLEEERYVQSQKRQREEEAYRNKVQQREQMLLAKMAEMEKRIGTSSGAKTATGSQGPQDAVMQKKLEELEKRMMNENALVGKVEEMEKRLKETEERLMKEKQMSQMLMGVLGSKEGPELESAEKDIKIALLTATTEDLIKRLEATAKAMDDKFDGLTKKIETIKFSGPTGYVHKSGLSYDEINQKLTEIQTKLFQPDIDERESEQLNIEYEKLISELESTPEYKAELEAALQKWRAENTPLNKASFEKILTDMAAWNNTKKTSQFKKKPELKLLDITQDQLLKKISNDFRSYTTQNLSLDEARAIFHWLPEFRKDQEAQLQFVEQLKQKIESETKKPAVKPPPPIKAKNHVVMKKPPKKTDGASDFLAELLRKRKPVG